MVRTRYTLNLSSSGTPLVNARNAVFSFLYARHCSGEFLLRAEDIDAESRPAPGKPEDSLETLRWLGLSWNGEVLKTGERLGFYQGFARDLLKQGRAYHCYCTPEEIEERKKSRLAEGLPQHYDGRCRSLTAVQTSRYESEGRKPSIRFMIYENGFTYDDLFKGTTEVPGGIIGDFVILRGNGTPTPLFAEAADDCGAGVTHVFKTEEPLSGLARQLMVYKALEKAMPKIAQLPVLTDRDGRKLSRQSAGLKGLHLEDFRVLGYPPEALVNYFALLGWTCPDGREILHPEELASLFDPEGKPTVSAEFDQGKLDWISRHYILNEDKDRLFEKAMPFLPGTEAKSAQENFLKGVVELAKGYCSSLSEIKDHALYFIGDDFPFGSDAEALLKRSDSAAVLQAFREWTASDGRTMDENIFGEMIGALSRKTGLKGRSLFSVIRAALTGRTEGPEMVYLIPVIGKDRTLARIDRAVKLAGN